MQPQHPHRTHADRSDRGSHDEPAVIGCALRHVTRATSRYPRLTMSLVLLAAFAAAGYTATCLDFRTERSDLIHPESAFQQRWLRYTEEFGDESDMVIVVEAEHPQTVRRVLDDIGPRLEREPELFRDPLYKIDTARLRRKGLQYFTPQQLQAGLENLREFDGPLAGRWGDVAVDAQFRSLARRLEDRLRRPESLTSDPVGPVLDRIGRLTGSLDAQLQGENGKGFVNPWPSMIPGEVPLTVGEVTYLLGDAGTMGFAKVKPAAHEDGFNGDTASVERLRKIVAEVAEQHPDARIGLTGIPILENDEMRRSQSDMTVASLISLIAVGVLMFVGFRGVRHPLLALVMLLVGMAWTFGYTTLVVGHLNILSVSFAVILIGLGIDFAIHYLARYLELRHQGRDLRPALKETSNTVGTGILTAAVTTALAFFCATLTDFLGVAELGIIAGGGILICAAATFLVLPALVSLSDGNLEPRRLPAPFDGHVLRNFIARFPRIVLIGSAVVIVGLATQVVRVGEDGPDWRVRYDANLLNLQADGIESVEVQQRAFGQADHSLLYAVSLADSPEQARALRQRFEQLPTVAKVEDLASRLPAHPVQQTRPYIEAYRQRLARLPSYVPQSSRLNPASVGRAMEEALNAVRRTRHPDAEAVAKSIDGFLNRFETLTLAQQAEFLTGFQMRMTGALLAQFQTLAAATDTTQLTWNDLPTQLQGRYVSDGGKWLLQIFPKEEVWDAEPLARFVQDVRSVDPEVTGTPLQNYEASLQIRRSYQDASLYALAVILLVLLVDFLGREQKLLVLGPPLAVVMFAWMMLETRRIDVSPVLLIGAYLIMAVASAAILDFRNLRDALLAMTPSLAGGLMMFGLLGLFGIDLNPANLIVLPLVLGIGVDDGVHVIHDFRAQAGGRYKTSSSTMNAIVLTSLTTMAGFGSMLVAAHRGLSSLGVVMVVGVGSCLFVSLVALPAILTLLSPGGSGQSAGGAAGQGDAEDARTLAARGGKGHQQHGKRRAG